MFYIGIKFIQYRSSPEPLWLYDIFNPFMVHLWFAYENWCGLAQWTSSPGRTNPDSYNSTFYIYKGIYFFYRAKWRNLNKKQLRLVRNFFCSCCCTFSILLGYVIYVNVNMLIEINSLMGTNWSKFFRNFCKILRHWCLTEP